MTESSGAPSRIRRRIPRKERRRLLLKAGADLVRDRFRRGSLDPLGDVTAVHVEEQALKTALEETGEPLHLSRGPIYYLWAGGFPEYRADLALELCERSFDSHGFDEEGLRVFEQEREWRQIVRRLANWEFDRLGPDGRDHEDHRLYALLSASPSPQLVERLEVRTEESLDAFAAIYKVFIESTGRRIRLANGQTEQQQLRLLASILAAMTSGFSTEADFDHNLTQLVEIPEHGSDWSPFAVAVLAVVELLTEDAKQITTRHPRSKNGPKA